MDQSIASSCKDEVQQEEKDARNMVEKIYNKRFGGSKRVQQDDLKELNLGTENDPKMVKVSIYVDGDSRIFTGIVTVVTGYKHVFSWDYSDVKGIDPMLHQHHISLREDAVPIVQQWCHMNPNFAAQVKQVINTLMSSSKVLQSLMDPFTYFKVEINCHDEKNVRWLTSVTFMQKRRWNR